ncbi:MAG: EamA family transporter [Anaerolineales bacterium]|jgi:drug/metabolite transporter (DMT)-like permease
MKDKTITPPSLFHLAVVYIVWGSTYLAIRVAVREGSGFPPFIMGFLRVWTAGLILLIWAWLRKRRVKPTPAEWGTLVGSGLLLWTAANGLVIWAEVRADSGLTALLVASMPIWAAIIEAFLDRKLPSPLLIISLLVGFIGIGFLAAPNLTSGVRAELLSTIALIIAPLCWALGSVLQARRPVALTPQVNSAYQMLVGSVGFFILAFFIVREPLPTPNQDAWLAWAYLVVFGSLLAYTSYVTVLGMLPINIVMTYAYVNPLIAVILGYLILQEEITTWTIGGMVFVLLGVAGVFRDRYRNRDNG